MRKFSSLTRAHENAPNPNGRSSKVDGPKGKISEKSQWHIYLNINANLIKYRKNSTFFKNNKIDHL